MKKIFIKAILVLAVISALSLSLCSCEDEGAEALPGSGTASGWEDIFGTLSDGQSGMQFNSSITIPGDWVPVN